MVPRYQHIRKLVSLNPRKSETGSAILAALAVIVALMLITSYSLSFAKDKYSSVSQSSSYQESLYAAEAGIDIARTALRQALSDSSAAWSGWTSDPSSGTGFPKTRSYTLPVYDPGTPVDISRPWGSTISVKVELPVNTGINPTGTSAAAYRVTSTGTVDVSGTPQVTKDSTESRLRRVNLLKDWRTNLAVPNDPGTGAPRPNVSRRVEAILKPLSPFVGAIIADDNIEIKKGKTEIIDSFNSDMGKYDPSKRALTITGTAPNAANSGYGGTMAANAKKGDVIRIENATVYGDLYKNTGGTVNLKSTATLTGIVHDGFYMKLDQAPTPRGNPIWTASGYTTTSAKPGSKATNITASSSSTAPARFLFTTLHLHDKDILTIKAPAGASESWAEIWCSDSLRLHKGGIVIVEKGVHVKFFCEKCIHLESKDGKAPVIKYQNQNLAVDTFVPQSAGGGTYKRENYYAEFYGVLPDKKKESHLKIKGQFGGVVHAPRHEVEVKLNDAANNDVYASFVVRKFKAQGVTQVHYDEAMASLGTVTDYVVSNWTEDWTDKKAAY